MNSSHFASVDFDEGGIGFQPVKFYRSCLRFAVQQYAHRLEAYATWQAAGDCAFDEPPMNTDIGWRLQ